jgi:tetratricopeptide (TPR) repeat protein
MLKLATIFLISALVPLSALFIPAPAQGQQNQLTAIRDSFFKGDYAQAISMYSQLPQDLRDSPLVRLWVGQSYYRTHDFEHAREFVQKADEGNLPPPQKQRAQSVLQQLDKIKEICPPLYHDYTLDGYTIRIYAKDSIWTKSIAAQMPTFLARAKEAFGNSKAFIAMYLCEDRGAYDKFFEAFTSAPPGKVHRGTGGNHMIVFCRYYPSGAEVGQNDTNDLYFRVLHEYSHALCDTIYGDHFKMPSYLNEGMADYFGWKYKPNGADLAKVHLQKLASTRRALTYDELSHNLYRDSEMGYTTGDVIVSTFFANKPLSIYAQIIQLARSSNGNFEYALQQVTGRNPEECYSQIVRAYWKRAAK